MPIQSRLLSGLPGIIHGFGDRAENVPQPFSGPSWDWEAERPRCKQVHGARAVELEDAAQVCGEADAMWTRLLRVPAAVMTADCVPVLLARKDGGAVAAVHAGWKGTRARILEKLCAGLAAQGERAADWVAAIGPSIGPCCYEVSEELARDFALEFGALAVPSFRHLDLPLINRMQLEALGLAEVDLLRACTRCSLNPEGEPIYHSYRREGGGTRNWSVIAGI